MPMEGQSQDFADYVATARRDGSVRIDSPEGELFIIVPKHRASSALTPFDDGGELLRLPLARAAYSDRTAWLMASLSALAYVPFEKDVQTRQNLVTALAKANLALIDIFDNKETGTEAFLAHRKGAYCVLAFRGTEKDRRDILTDLSARFYNTPAGKAHRGFSVAYQSVRGHIVPALERVLAVDPDCQIFVTGHSLGGALATSAACDLENRFFVAACYTFGSPRVGTPDWSDGMKTPVYRVVNGADGVPLVPGGAVTEWVINRLPDVAGLRFIKKQMKKGFVGFQHCGDFRFIYDREDVPWLKTGSAAVWERIKYITLGKIADAIKRLKPGALSAIFADHSVVQYQTKLRAIAERRNQKIA